MKALKAFLNPGGYLAIADLYAEDSSFHSDGFHRYLGSEIDVLAKKL